MTSPRPDTRYLATSPITTDAGQYDTDLTATGSGGYEDNSVRTALSGTGSGRALELSIELDNNDDATLIAHGPDVPQTAYRITVAAGQVRFFDDGSGGVDVTLDAPNVNGTAKTYIVGWSTEPNPLTTGSSNALRSEVFVYDVDGSELAYSVVVHAVRTASASGAFAVGGYWDGDSLEAQFSAINAVRVSGRFHSRVETREHFVAQTAAPDNDGIEACEEPLVPDAVCSAGALVGPAYQAAARSMAVGCNRHRVVGPQVSIIIPTMPTWQVDLGDTATPTRVRTLSDGYQTQTGWLWRCQIPTHAEWLIPAVQWATWNTSAEAFTASLRFYCANASPAVALEWQTSTVTRTVDDGAGGGSGGTGVITTASPLLVRRNDDGDSWLWLGLDITETTPDSTKVNLRNVTLTSLSKPALGNQQPLAIGG